MPHHDLLSRELARYVTVQHDPTGTLTLTARHAPITVTAHTDPITRTIHARGTLIAGYDAAGIPYADRINLSRLFPPHARLAGNVSQALQSAGTLRITRSLLSAEPGCSGEHHGLLTLGPLTYPATLREYGTGTARTGHLDVNAHGHTWLHLLTLYARGGGSVNDQLLQLLRLPEHKRARHALTLAYQPYQRRAHLSH